MLFTEFIIAVIGFGIFALFDLYDDPKWKTGVIILSQLIKIIGNKGMLLIVKVVKPPFWVADAQLFMYGKN